MKPSIPKGTRDFGPAEVLKRNYIFDTIREVFVRYGFQPIETPAMEDLSTLTGKYGEEGDQLLFKVLNNGDFLSKADDQALQAKDSAKLVPSISKRGLRYDLTVPFARFVAMHQNDIPFPFKRYQIQPVWRADRPQKGRYQEFYQCDVDVVGSESLMFEAELAQIYDEVFQKLGLKVVIKLNNRKILAGMAEAAGLSEDRFMDMTIAIDKLDKIGMDGVKQELSKRDISDDAIAKIEAMLGTTELEALKATFAASETGLKGIEELETVFSYLNLGDTHNTIQFDITLARGLNYYTGCIYEVAVDLSAQGQENIKMGSIGGGGRYANLTENFGMKTNGSGVGVSFGAERIYDVMEELSLFPEDKANTLQLLFIAFDEKAHRYAFKALQQVRAAGINAELYPEPTKLKKQMKYADQRNVPYTIVIGDREMESGELAFKNMATGQQENLQLNAIIDQLK
ncbi:histidine--tRNA ligase [Phaeodactylibacter sp.]|uniref:histidine--tRNA ligase n=1 Tax=Phaeodactylibacter sp. TaxID=1940289 RepID=UPI0025FCEDD2|nr:histidine--tRNA ligase [Phaeodactylibacter sp.]MCI4650437.1 histidine--tRNA ligase [Phaeodactylibacter sp.]MCI5093849.1 histidine--tRNA ligase [Phaeodactylibacter sp.]